jgi:hypothetical protein
MHVFNWQNKWQILLIQLPGLHWYFGVRQHAVAQHRQPAGKQGKGPAGCAAGTGRPAAAAATPRVLDNSTTDSCLCPSLQSICVCCCTPLELHMALWLAGLMQLTMLYFCTRSMTMTAGCEQQPQMRGAAWRWHRRRWLTSSRLDTRERMHTGPVCLRS